MISYNEYNLSKNTQWIEPGLKPDCLFLGLNDFNQQCDSIAYTSMHICMHTYININLLVIVAADYLCTICTLVRGFKWPGLSCSEFSNTEQE